MNAENHTLNHAKISSAHVAQYDSEDKRQDVSFKYTFDKDTELVGNMNLKLWVSTTDSDDMDLFAGIKKLDRRGNEVNFPDFNHIENGQVATGWLRVSHRELDQEKSTIAQPWHKHETELKLSQDEIVPVEIVIGNSTPGMKTRYEHEETVNKGMHMIYTGSKYDSQLIIPIVN